MNEKNVYKINIHIQIIRHCLDWINNKTETIKTKGVLSSEDHIVMQKSQEIEVIKNIIGEQLEKIEQKIREKNEQKTSLH